MAVGLVEQPEAIDVDEGDTEGRAVVARLLDGERQLADQGAMVEQPGQRVAPGGLDQGGGLAGDASLGGAEDHPEHEGSHEGGREGRQDDAAAQAIELGQDGGRVTRDPHHGVDAVVGLEWEVLAQDLGREGLIEAGRHARRVHGIAKVLGLRGPGAGHLRPIPDDDGAVRTEDVDVLDLRARNEQRDRAFELGPPSRRERALEVGGQDGAIDEAADECGVRADDRLHRGLRVGRRDHEGLGDRRHAHDHQEDAVDEHEQDRARHARSSTEHRWRTST